MKCDNSIIAKEGSNRYNCITLFRDFDLDDLVFVGLEHQRVDLLSGQARLYRRIKRLINHGRINPVGIEILIIRRRIRNGND